MQADQDPNDEVHNVMENWMRYYVAVGGGVAPLRVQVKMSLEPLDGAETWRVEVYLDGKRWPDGEAFVAAFRFGVKAAMEKRAAMASELEVAVVPFLDGDAAERTGA